MVIDPSMHHHWNWLIGAAILFGSALYALVTGKVAMLYSMTKKSEYPVLYWIGVVTYGVLGVSFVVMVFW